MNDTDFPEYGRQCEFFHCIFIYLFPLDPVVCLAEHLAICLVRCSAFAPGCHMVCIHLTELIDPSPLAVVIAHGTVRAVGFSV